MLAFPSAGLVPSGTPMKNLSNDPPPGVGPYMLTDVSPNRTFSLVKNARFASLKIPDIPLGHLDRIRVNITSNTQSEAEQVLKNQADAFDAGDTLPPSLLPQIQADASDRFSRETIPSTFYFFLNTQTKPFDNPLARQAVNLALDRRALVRLASGFLKPACYFLPEGIAGHPTGPCPYGDPNAAPDVAKAKQLVKQAGLVGTPVTVWGETRSPRKQYVEYYTSVLNEIGFKATPKIISDSVYFPTIGNAQTNPQTGFADWLQDFPNPSDFYLLMDADEHPADQQPELQQGRRPAHPARAGQARRGPGDAPRLGGRRMAEARRVRGEEGLRRGLRVGGAAEVPLRTGSTSVRRSSTRCT